MVVVVESFAASQQRDDARVPRLVTESAIPEPMRDAIDEATQQEVEASMNAAACPTSDQAEDRRQTSRQEGVSEEEQKDDVADRSSDQAVHTDPDQESAVAVIEVPAVCGSHLNVTGPLVDDAGIVVEFFTVDCSIVYKNSPKSEYVRAMRISRNIGACVVFAMNCYPFSRLDASGDPDEYFEMGGQKWPDNDAAMGQGSVQPHCGSKVGRHADGDSHAERVVNGCDEEYEDDLHVEVLSLRAGTD